MAIPLSIDQDDRSVSQRPDAEVPLGEHLPYGRLPHDYGHLSLAV